MAKQKKTNKNLPEFILCPSFEQEPLATTTRTTTTMAQVVEPKKAFVVVKDTELASNDKDNTSFLTRSKGTYTPDSVFFVRCVGSLSIDFSKVNIFADILFVLDCFHRL